MAFDFTRGNCALYLTLKHKASGKLMQVIGTHLHWNQTRDFVKYAQIINTAENAKKDMPLLLCGDLNASPDSNTFGYLTDPNHEPVVHPKVQKSKIGFYAQV